MMYNDVIRFWHQKVSDMHKLSRVESLYLNVSIHVLLSLVIAGCTWG